MWVPVRLEGLGGVDASRHFAELHRLVSRQTRFRCWLGSWLSKGVSRASAETNAGRHTLAYRFAGRREATAQLFGGTFFLLAVEGSPSVGGSATFGSSRGPSVSSGQVPSGVGPTVDHCQKDKDDGDWEESCDSSCV